ncbi:MAG TPA: alpha/beta hydrolase [Bryobacteraceae bacterium]|nr:alpha/beta hydrolase [Bryobacteraceae bacterium]
MTRNLLLFALAPFAGSLLAQQPTAPAIPDNLTYEAGVAYAQADPQQVMDIVRPRDGRGHPAILCIHGGGFRAGSRKGYVAQCVRLAQHGYVAATTDYRLAPGAQFPAAVNDVKAAVRYLRANAERLGIDPSRIGTMGGSAGGHLALFLGVTGGVAQFEGDGPNRSQSSRVSCVVSYFGPSDLTKSYGRSVDAAEVLPLFLGGDVQHARLRHIQASPLYWVTPEAAPTLAIQGTKDRYVNYEQSVWIIDRLLASGVEAELETIPGADHGFKGADAERAEQRMIEFFDRHLKHP